MSHEPPRSDDPPRAPTTALRALAEPKLLFPVIAALLLGLLWFITAGLVRVVRTDAVAASVALTAELLETYEAQAVRVLREIDHTLRLLQLEAERGERISLAELDSRGLLPPSLVFTVSVFDPVGELVATTDATARPDLSPDELAALSEEPDLAVGKPVVDPSTATWLLRFGRALRDPTGGFAGVATVTVESAFFVSGYEPAELGELGVLGLVGTDGVFRARRIGEQVSAGEVAIQPPGEDGVVRRISHAWDGVERFAAERTLYDFPLRVLVGVAVDEALAPAARRARSYVWRASAASVLLVGLIALLFRLSWQLQQLRNREYLAQVAHAERVEHIAYHDGLTGLPNRSFFGKLLEQKTAEAARSGRELAVLFVDLDRFKQINDTLGHEAGDELLREVARRLSSCLRESDVVARLGGDEFVVLLHDLAAGRYAATVADKILCEIARPFVLLGQDFRVTGSVGIAVYPKDGRDEQTLTKNADIAMYRAKEEGKNRYQFYAEEINANSLERLAFEASLRRALDQGEFRLHYQARRDAASGRITGVEALLRWEHPDLSIVPPLQFLSVAEETGLIVPIGRWVLRSACAQNVAWQAEGAPRIPIAINLATRQVFDEHLVEDVRNVLAETGMAPDLLELEVLEETLLRDVATTLRVLRALKDLGVRIVVDHFGAGYSSIANLERYPLDAIKIDRSFVRETSTSSGLTDAVVALGRSLHVTVVAQGVETAEQAEFLREHGCHEVQGFYVHRPMPAGELGDLLRAPAHELAAFAGRSWAELARTRSKPRRATAESAPPARDERGSRAGGR